MKRKVVKGLIVAGAVLALIAASGAGLYASWCAHGDVVNFSVAGDLGWGTHPYYMYDSKKGPHKVGFVQSYAFIGHARIDDTQVDRLVLPAR